MTVKSLRQACIEVCCTAEVFRRLGYDADDIYFGRCEAVNDKLIDILNEDKVTPQKGDLFVELRRLEGPPFTVAIQNPERGRKDWSRVLAQTVEAWNAGRVDESQWDASHARAQAVLITAAMVKAGWKIKKPLPPAPSASA
jgi:hypothetical protein